MNGEELQILKIRPKKLDNFDIRIHFKMDTRFFRIGQFLKKKMKTFYSSHKTKHIRS